MPDKKRNLFNKLNTLLFGKDIRVTEGTPYTEIRKYDFSSYYPEADYISKQALPTENVYDIRTYGASADGSETDNAAYINNAVCDAAKTGGTVLIDGGDYTATTVFLKSNVTLFIAAGSSVTANKTGIG